MLYLISQVGMAVNSGSCGQINHRLFETFSFFICKTSYIPGSSSTHSYQSNFTFRNHFLFTKPCKYNIEHWEGTKYCEEYQG